MIVWGSGRGSVSYLLQRTCSLLGDIPKIRLDELPRGCLHAGGSIEGIDVVSHLTGDQSLNPADQPCEPAEEGPDDCHHPEAGFVARSASLQALDAGNSQDE